jgi:hypothetical protein
MSHFVLFLCAILASYGAFELFVMATHSDKERRPFVILQIASGFGLCIWVIFDKSLISIPVLLALVFIAADRLQTRLMRWKR